MGKAGHHLECKMMECVGTRVAAQILTSRRSQRIVVQVPPGIHHVLDPIQMYQAILAVLQGYAQTDSV